LPSVASRKLSQAIFLLFILLCSTANATVFQSSRILPSSGTINYPTTAGNKAVISNLNPYQGTYHAGFQTSSIPSGVNYAYSYLDLVTPVSEVYARAYFYIANGLPLNDDEDRVGLIGLEVNGQLQTTLRIYRSGGIDRFNIAGLNGSSSISKSTDNVYPVEGKWYCLELYIKVHGSTGEYRAWINGVEQITITNVNTALYGSGVTRVRFGLTYTSNVQHTVQVACDSVVVSTGPIGLLCTFGVIGDAAVVPAIRNFYWLFGNQSINYKVLRPSDVNDFADVALYKGLVVWTKHGGYDAAAIRKFAQNHVVISDAWDFCEILYPSLSGSIQVVSTNTVTYARDWGNFHSGDLVEMCNETGNVGKLTTVLASGLASFTNITVIADYDANRIALFFMNGQQSNSGFCVMDLDATTPETDYTGIWHVFPAIKMVQDFPTGKYAEWMANGEVWWDLNWVYNRIDTLVNENKDVAQEYNIGYSVEGRPIPVIKIGTGQRYAIIDAAIHGNEKTGTFASLRIAELLIQYYRSDPYWTSRLKQYTVLIIPVLNPDGFVHNTRENANGTDLNRQFPPGGTTTEPEALALKSLMDSCKPTVYINMHEGGEWYPLDMLWGVYETGTNKALTGMAMHDANNTFTALKHWGWYTKDNMTVWIGTVRGIYSAGINSMAVAYASYTYGTSCMLLETFVWSPRDGARKCLWGIDYYTAVVISFLQHIQR
jgi:hypothetical protein